MCDKSKLKIIIAIIIIIIYMCIAVLHYIRYEYFTVNYYKELFVVKCGGIKIKKAVQVIGTMDLPSPINQDVTLLYLMAVRTLDKEDTVEDQKIFQVPLYQRICMDNFFVPLDREIYELLV